MSGRQRECFSVRRDFAKINLPLRGQVINGAEWATLHQIDYLGVISRLDLHHSAFRNAVIDLHIGETSELAAALGLRVEGQIIEGLFAVGIENDLLVVMSQDQRAVGQEAVAVRVGEISVVRCFHDLFDEWAGRCGAAVARGKEITGAQNRETA